MFNNEIKEAQENYNRVKQNIAQEGYFISIKKPILEWAKDYPVNNTNNYYYSYFFFFIKSVFIEQKLSRLQAYALVGLIVELLYNEGYMNDEIDNFIDNALFSRINGDGNSADTLTFPDDPFGQNSQEYAWSGKWRMWQG